ncbi:hypothetical protein RZS08_53450, partial [Arthrospira platensis SPKY1]|nr:hypothetical protein [Arthrospira platensis SPKY1]
SLARWRTGSIRTPRWSNASGAFTAARSAPCRCSGRRKAHPGRQRPPGRVTIRAVPRTRRGGP